MSIKKQKKKGPEKNKNSSGDPVKKRNKKPGSSDFPIVGIGASAGGLEALELFFTNLPKNCGMAFVIIQHLDPNHKGSMPELLQRFTDMKVCQVSDGLKIKPNCVYLIPPNKSMSMLKSTLHLFETTEARGLHLPIDIFFRSMAEDIQEKSIGIILSGMGSDGSLGIKAIKEKNGIVVVQEPGSAKFEGMPRSAIESVIAHIVAPVEELPVKLMEYLNSIPMVKEEPLINNKNKSNIEKIIILLRDHTGHDFSMYKKNTLFRRIERRKAVHQIDKIHNYVRFLQENPQEIDILFKEMLIGVTNFFRDMPVWDKMRDDILPQMINELSDGYMLRAWVPGCSTGEEAYTLAIVFKEAMEKLKKQKKISMQIFATDLDADAIDRARKGIFPPNIATDVSPSRINRFFSAESEGYRINATIREMVVFAPQNVIKDPPFTKLDIISCRNILIYMEPELQKKLINLFSYSLNTNGILMLGTAETLGTHNENFKEISTKLKIFRRSSINTQSELMDFPSAYKINVETVAGKKAHTRIFENIQVMTDQLLLQYFTPASVLVNESGDIIYITGRTGKYLEPPAGKANWNIHVMAREGLRHELPGMFRKAMQNHEPVVMKNITIRINGGKLTIDVIVQRLEKPEALKGLIIVVFQETHHIPTLEKTDMNKVKGTKPAKQKELEMELQKSYEDLQSLREEMQTSQEELKSTNEELQSTNEELQSTNEELTTSKEEMQSLNEELQTVNAELQNKVVEYARANNDMKNLLNSTAIATLFLDRDLNIRRFTDQATHIFKLRNTDIGRPFTDIVTDLVYPEITDHAMEVIRTLASIETAIATNDKRWYNVRIMPYRTQDDRIDGLVITFTDITTAKNMEQDLMKNEERYRELLTNINMGIIVFAPDFSVTMNNPRALELFGLERNQKINLLQNNIRWDAGSKKDNPSLAIKSVVEMIITGKKPITNQIMNVIKPGTDDTVLFMINGFPIFNSKYEISEIIISFTDISICRDAEEEPGFNKGN